MSRQQCIGRVFCQSLAVEWSSREWFEKYSFIVHHCYLASDCTELNSAYIQIDGQVALMILSIPREAINFPLQ
jgi:hypothetical protein